jgi:hypothetical protein
MVPVAPTGTAPNPPQQPPLSSVTSALALTPSTPLVLAPAMPTFPSVPSHMPAPVPTPMPVPAPVGTLVTAMPFNTMAPHSMDSPITATEMLPLIGSGRNHDGGDTSM